jgi:hypothetical protein
MKKLVIPKLAKALVLAGALIAVNMAPMTARADAGGTNCLVPVLPGQTCSVSTDCFMGVCTCIVVCCCG